MSKTALYVSEGDIVELFFDHYSDAADRSATGRVLNVHKRYGTMTLSGARTQPLIEYVILETGEQSSADQGFVVRVVERYSGPTLPRKNVFADRNALLADRRKDHPEFNFRPYERISRSTIQGVVTDMVLYFMGQLNTELKMPADPDRIWYLFSKQRPGLVTSPYAVHGYVRVHEKPFRAWVRANAHRFCMTAKEADADENQIYEIEAEEYSISYHGFDEPFGSSEGADSNQIDDSDEHDWPDDEPRDIMDWYDGIDRGSEFLEDTPLGRDRGK